MPELPEVETIVRELSRHLPGRRILGVKVDRPDVLRHRPGHFCSQLRGRGIESVRRRGKNILLDLDTGGLLVVNLGMTGKLLFQGSSAQGSSRGGQRREPGEPQHLAVTLHLDPPAHLYYSDIRRFGSLRLFNSFEWELESDRLGPEPLDPSLTGDMFHDLLLRSRSPVRSWLLDQTRVAGVGNIYAVEALFMAGIHPQRPAQSLNRREGNLLLRTLRDVLSQAIEAGGTTLRDYRNASGKPGDFGSSLRVYGREGLSCPRCKERIQRIVFANRSAFFCPGCQPNV